MAEAKENSQQTQEEAQKRAEEKRKEEAARLEELKKRAIIFRMGEETGIVIEKTKDQFEHSLFSEQYMQALKLVNDIIRVPADYDTNAPISNIIAFCGERGEGKTSALMTVRNILADTELYKLSKELGLFPEKNEIKEDTFKVLNLVDPAFFDGHHNILELLLGQMYAEVLLDSKNDKKDNSLDCEFRLTDRISERNHLMQLFQAVRSSLGIISRPSNKSAYDNLEEIDELAVGIMLKEKFNKLLKAYAKYFDKDRVLICIDDLDLNVSEGYKMAEEIRKYLSSPAECVVLMAIKVEQMIDVVKSYLRKRINEIVSNDEIIDMATRYVTKLLPESHRVIMPSGHGMVQLPLTIKENNTSITYDSVKEAVVRLVYLKTRYIFVNGRNLSAIVPTNLRSLRHLIALLWLMPDAKKDKNVDNKENKEKFKNYFYRSWIRLLDKEDERFVSGLTTTDDISSINKYIIQRLKKMIVKDTLINDALLRSILNDNNQIQNISTGDVFYVVKHIESIYTDAKTTNLLFFIKAFYSIKLYETYDFISRDLESLFITPDKCLTPETIEKEDNKQDSKDVKNENPEASKVDTKEESQEEQKAPSIYKYDVQLRQLNLLQRLLNGGYFTYRKGSLIPSEKGGNDRDLRRINGDKLREAFSKIQDANITEEERLVYLHICEFFALTIIRSYKTKDSISLIFDRQQSGRAYFDQYNSSRRSYIFDVLSIFYNVVNIQQTYNRWDQIFKDDFFAYAYKEPKSFLNSILDSCDREYTNADSTLPDKIHHFISDSIIRFSELMLSILDNAENQRNVYSEGGNANNLKIFYDNLLKIGITLYPLDPTNIEDKGYPLEFIFLKKSSKLLEEIRVAKEKIDNEAKEKEQEITPEERLLSQVFDDIYGKAEEGESDEELDLDYIFRNSLAKKGIRYPKSKDKVIEYIKTKDNLLYETNTEFWLQIIDEKDYQSWSEVKKELTPYLDDIIQLYQSVYNIEN